MKINEIKTPEDILEYLNEYIRYGWIDVNGCEHINNMKDFRRLYRTSDFQNTISHKLGTCIEQVYLIHILLDKLNIPNRMFCSRIYENDSNNHLDEEEHMHCFCLYYLNGRVYHLEHPNYEKAGIYEYNSIDEAINKINNYYVDMSGGYPRPVTEFYEVESGLSFWEFNKYINSLDEYKNKKNL